MRRACTRCVLDEHVTDITFDADGVCSYCREFAATRERRRRESGNGLDAIVAAARAAGRARRYDAIVGVSGGLDSSYVLYAAVQAGLRVLAVHLDNGWNSELSVRNIEVLVRGLQVDLQTHVIDWEEFRALQRAYFKAQVVDIEVLTDNALSAVLYAAARRERVKHILAGTNSCNEGMRMPPGWNYHKLDKRNLLDIWRRFGDGRPLRTFPSISLLRQQWHEHINGVRWVSFLDYVPYVPEQASAELQRKLGWRPYEKKHYESVFTRFYQGHILPRKFGIDKRQLHFSNLIGAGLMTRDEALAQLQEEPYVDAAMLANDRAFVLKKLGYSEAEFAAYLAAKPVAHTDYRNEMGLRRLLNALARLYKGREVFQGD